MGHWLHQKTYQEKVMEIQFETREIELPKHARDQLVSRIRSAMKQAASKVRRLHITIKDVNGGKGGLDKVCTIEARLDGGGQVVVVDKGDTSAKAIFRGLSRCRKLVTREFEQRRRIDRQLLANTETGKRLQFSRTEDEKMSVDLISGVS
jgi:putative sigma-54 modulation protein